MSKTASFSNNDVGRVSDFLQDHMKAHGLKSMTADECADLLSNQSILQKTPPQPGFNFREMLRQGRDGKIDLVIGARQDRPRRRWHIERIPGMTERTKPPAKTLEVFQILKKCAQDMRTITYGEIAEEVGIAPTGIGFQLGYIRDELCIPRGLPWLNVIGVKKANRRPGDAFLPEGVSLEVDEELIWRGIVLQVFAYEWQSVEFE